MAALLVLAAAACQPAVASDGPPIAAAGPWRTALPPVTPIGPAGYTYGQELNRIITTGFGHASFNNWAYAPAVYSVPATQPTVPVTLWNCQNKPKLDSNLAIQLAAVPVPADAVIPPDSDAHVSVFQASSDTMWDLWKTRKVNGQWQACYGGRLDHYSASTGSFVWPWGATASGIGLQEGLITLADLQSGHINHAISIGVSSTLMNTFSWPATRTDGRTADPTALPLGQRLRIDPAVDLATLNLTPLGRMIAESMQKYGAIVRDTTVGSVAVYAEFPKSRLTTADPDPYLVYFGGKAKWAQLDPIPWVRLQALPLDYGKPVI